MKKLKIGYLGPQGTYSYIAAQKLCEGGEYFAYPTFFALFKALKSNAVDRIVLPIENTLNGAVTENLDLLQETEGVFAKQSCAVKIEHRLITRNGAAINGITDVYSHPQALAQCAKFLAATYPDARLHETASTADSIEKIKSKTDAGIVGAHCKREGYTLGDYSVSDVEKNYTQFLLVENGAPEDGAVSDRIFFTVTCRHEAGALVGLLTILKDNGINMTEIESRPIKDRTGEFRFFMEVEGDYSCKEIRGALERLKAAAHSYKLLGCYKCGLPK